jgi:hypothetical protein
MIANILRLDIVGSTFDYVIVGLLLTFSSLSPTGSC